MYRRFGCSLLPFLQFLEPAEVPVFDLVLAPSIHVLLQARPVLSILLQQANQKKVLF